MAAGGKRQKCCGPRLFLLLASVWSTGDAEGRARLPLYGSRHRAWQACAPRLGCAGTAAEGGASSANASTEPERWLCQAMAQFRLVQCVPRSPLFSQMDAARSSCAVVGSSSVLLGGQLGAEIDAHSVVIRANLAPLRSDGRQAPPFSGATRSLLLNRGDYRVDVGARTSCRLLNRQHGAQLAAELKAGTEARYAERVRAFVGDSAPAEMVIVHGKAFTNRLRDARVRRRCSLDPAALGNAADQRRAPSGVVLQLPHVDGPRTLTSSGLVAVLLALSRCHSLMAYGFGEMRRAGCPDPELPNPPRGARALKSREQMRYHYYQNHTALSHHRHAFLAEHMLMRTLARAGCFSS